MFFVLSFSIPAYADYNKIVQKNSNQHTVYVMSDTDWIANKMGNSYKTSGSKWIWESATGRSARYINGSLKFTWKKRTSREDDLTGFHLDTPNTTRYNGTTGKYYRIYTKFKANQAQKPLNIGYESIHQTTITTTGDWQVWEWYGLATPASQIDYNDFIYYLRNVGEGSNCEILVSDILINEEKNHYDQNHNWTGYTVTQNPTCTTGGTRYRDCRDCGYREWSNIAALGHAWDNNTWQRDGVNHWHRCTRCGATKDVAAHNWTYSNVNASTHDKTCTVCGYKISGEAHNFVNNKCACGRYNTVVVSFDLNLPTPEDGEPLKIGPNPSSIAPITYTYGDLYYESKYGLVEPKLQDYSFAGWWTMEEGGTLITTRRVNNANPHTLYAHWTATPLNIKNIESNDLYVIENNGQSEANYIKEHAPEDGLKFDYSTTQAEFIPTGENKVIIKDTLLNEDGTSKIALKNWTSYMSKGFSKSEDNGVLTFTYTKDNTPINGKDVTTWENGANNTIPVEKNKKYHCEAEVMIIGSVKHIVFGHDQSKEANIKIKNPSQNTWIKLSKDFTSKNDNITIGTDGLTHVYSGFVIRTLALDDVSPVTMKIRNIKFYEYDDSIDTSANTNYTYIWESKKPDGKWEPLNLDGVSTDKTTIKIDKANRSINQTKVRLTIRNNSGKKITSNEAKITVYYLPEIQ